MNVTPINEAERVAIENADKAYRLPRFMAPRRGATHGTDDPDHFRHVLHGEGDQ
jgi:hypothetical protein